MEKIRDIITEQDKIEDERRKELEKLKVEIKEKEKQYFNSLDKNLNGDSNILQELVALKKRRSRLMPAKKQITLNSLGEEKINVSEFRTFDDDENELEKIKKEIKEKEEKYHKSITEDLIVDTNTLQELIDLKEKVMSLTRKVVVPVSKTESNADTIIDTVDFESNKWIINYHAKGISRKEIYEITNEKLEENIKKLNQKFKNLDRIDIGLYSVLSEFDSKYKTNSSNAYLFNKKQLHTTYDLKELFSNNNYSLKDKINLLLTAYKQKKYNNAVVVKPKNRLAATAIVGFSLMLGLIGTAVSKNKIASNQSNNTKTKIENEISNEEIQSITNEIKKIDTHEKQIDSTDTKLESKTIKDKKEEFKLGDNYKLNNMELKYSYDSVDTEKVAKTKNLNCEYYKTLYVAVVNENQILDLKNTSNLDDQTLSNVVADYKNKFGNDIEIFLNFDGYDKNDNKIYSKVGWSSLIDLNVKSSNQAKIEQLKELKNELIGEKQKINNIKIKISK